TSGVLPPNNIQPPTPSAPSTTTTLAMMMILRVEPPPDAGAERSLRQEPSESESSGMRRQVPEIFDADRQVRRVMEFPPRHICEVSCRVREQCTCACLSSRRPSSRRAVTLDIDSTRRSIFYTAAPWPRH